MNGAFDGRGELARCVEYRVHYFGQYITYAHRDPARGDWPMGEALGRVRTIAADGGRAQRRPDESFGEMRVTGCKGFEVGERFPLLEQQFYWPAQAISVTEVLEIELGAGDW